MPKNRYCGMCKKWFPIIRTVWCPQCHSQTRALEKMPADGRACCEPTPDRSGRTCDRPKGHDGQHWTYGGSALTWEGRP